MPICVESAVHISFKLCKKTDPRRTAHLCTLYCRLSSGDVYYALSQGGQSGLQTLHQARRKLGSLQTGQGWNKLERKYKTAGLIKVSEILHQHMSSRYSALGRWGGVCVALAWDFPICYLKYVLFMRQKQSQMFRGLIFKGPTIYPFSDQYVSSWTPAKQLRTIIYQKKHH